MSKRRMAKIRRNALGLMIEHGSDVLFVAESPDMDLGDGACFLFGVGDYIDCARRLLNELKHKMGKTGIELDFRLTKIGEDK